MNWRHELRGVSRVDLVCAALIVPVSIWADTVVFSHDAEDVQDVQVPAQVQVQDAGDAYGETHAWCMQRFPYRADLQEACRWGAYEMLPGTDMPAIPTVPVTTDEGVRDV